MHHLTDDPALNAPEINLNPGPEYLARQWQGIPAIERAGNGRLWAAWYSGGEGEGPQNFVLLVTSDDDGRTWSPPALVIDPPGVVRAFDPCLWIDPRGRLWLCWVQSEGLFDGRCGVWAVRCEDPGSASPAWSAPRRLGHGIMMNKPTVLSTGEWLFPAAIWDREPRRPDMTNERRANVLCSTDDGDTWALRGGAVVPDRNCDEHMVVERRDGSLWMLVRTKAGIAESVSTDGGHSWSPGRHALPGPCSRFFLRRLHSGNLLLVNHHRFTGRNNLTAFLSTDDGQSWQGGLLLDARDQVSYPDGVQAEDGRIYVIYDRERYAAREILLAVFTEEDVLAGQPGDGTRLQQVVNRAAE
ncbi:MAG: sialidase family protein [Armatimonadota bacterium]